MSGGHSTWIPCETCLDTDHPRSTHEPSAAAPTRCARRLPRGGHACRPVAVVGACCPDASSIDSALPVRARQGERRRSEALDVGPGGRHRHGARRRPGAGARGGRGGRKASRRARGRDVLHRSQPAAATPQLDSPGAAPRPLDRPSDKEGPPRDRSPTGALTSFAVALPRKAKRHAGSLEGPVRWVPTRRRGRCLPLRFRVRCSWRLARRAPASTTTKVPTNLGRQCSGHRRDRSPRTSVLLVLKGQSLDSSRLAIWRRLQLFWHLDAPIPGARRRRSGAACG